MFRLDTPLPELVVRGVVIYAAVLTLLRLTGQRESGGLGLTDVLIVVMIAQAVGGGLVGESHSVTDAVVLAATILLCSVAVDALAYRFPALSGLLKARPRPLIEDGRLNHRLMRRELLTTEEVLSQLRLHGIQDLAEVRCAYLEPNGMISVVARHGQDTSGPPRPPAL